MSLSIQQTKDFVLQHGKLTKHGHVKLDKPLYGFKKVYNGKDMQCCVANLIIPAGALVNMPQSTSMKMRANKAYCWNIISIENTRGFGPDVYKEVSSAYSGHNESFNYTSIKGHRKNFSLASLKQICSYPIPDDFLDKSLMCLPKNGYLSKFTDECAPGIHFFLESRLAEKY